MCRSAGDNSGIERSKEGLEVGFEKENRQTDRRLSPRCHHSHVKDPRTARKEIEASSEHLVDGISWNETPEPLRSFARRSELGSGAHAPGDPRRSVKAGIERHEYRRRGDAVARASCVELEEQEWHPGMEVRRRIDPATRQISHPCPGRVACGDAFHRGIRRRPDQRVSTPILRCDRKSEVDRIVVGKATFEAERDNSPRDSVRQGNEVTTG